MPTPVERLARIIDPNKWAFCDSVLMRYKDNGQTESYDAAMKLVPHHCKHSIESAERILSAAPILALEAEVIEALENFAQLEKHHDGEAIVPNYVLPNKWVAHASALLSKLKGDSDESK